MLLEDGMNFISLVVGHTVSNIDALGHCRVLIGMMKKEGAAKVALKVANDVIQIRAAAAICVV